MEQIGGDNDMKRILALTLCILTLLACVSPAQAASYVYVRQTDVFYAESYYHKNPNCAFAAHLDPWATVKLIKCSVATAEKNYCRPCPVCAYTFKPVFTGSFPKWTHKTPPYYLWSGNTEEIAVDYYLPTSTLNRFGNVPAKIQQWCKTRNPSKYFAGVVRNDSGTYNIMMTNPTAGKAADWKKRLGCDFWVLEAKYSEKQLKNLQAYAAKLIGKYGIKYVDMGVPENRVKIGTLDNSRANTKKIYAAFTAKGYPLDAIYIWKCQ